MAEKKRYNYIYTIDSLVAGTSKRRVYSCLATDKADSYSKWTDHKRLLFMPYGTSITLIDIECDADFVDAMEITRWIIDGDYYD